MPPRLKRFQTSGPNHFVTFSCFQRQPLLNDDHSRSTFLRILEQTRQRHGFHVYAYVLMPEHVHLLLSEPRGSLLANTLRALKTQTSKQLKGDFSQFWQRRYYDFNVFTRPKFSEKLQYIHRNPVTRGLVEKPEEWPWSSYTHWLKGQPEIVNIESRWTLKPQNEIRVPHS